MKKISFISTPGLENFMLPVAKGLEGRGYQVKTVYEPDDQKIVDAVLWSDTVWIEWGNELAMHLTTDAGLLNQRNVILRIHSYEAFLPYIKYINYERVDALIFVADHIKDLVLEQVPKIEKMVSNIRVIPNGVDVGHIPFKDRTHGHNIAYIGYLNFKKGPMLLVHAFQRLAEYDEELQLHIAGTFQEPRYELYFKQFLDKTGLADRVHFYGQVNNIPAWLEDKNYILSTSVMESQGMGIMEAMAAGIKPLVHDFYGAENIYPETWATISDLKKMVFTGTYNSGSYRKLIIDRYSLSGELDAIENLTGKLEEKRVIQTPTKDTEDMKPATLTVAMMVKDEEKNIRRCLDSVKRFADEIIIVDTGSIDKTIEIAREYTDKIYEHPWENFSVHRNQSIGYSTQEWILTIDADEEFIGNGEDFKRALMAVSPTCDSMCLWLHDLRPDGSVAVKHHPVRTFKRGTVHYEGSVHNEPMFDRNKAAFWYDGHLNHYGYHGDAELKAKKSKRTIGLLEKELVENPSRTKVLFYLFQSYCDIGQIEKGLQFGEQYISKRHISHDFNESIYFSMISAYLSLGNINRAKQILNEALMVIPNDIDIATAMVEIAVACNDGMMAIEGANKYVMAYRYMESAPGVTGTRFTYSFKPDSLAYILHRAAMCHFENGARFGKELKKSIGSLDKQTGNKVLEEFNRNMKTLGLTMK